MKNAWNIKTGYFRMPFTVITLDAIEIAQIINVIYSTTEICKS